jgi:hypothetical protein
LHGAITLRGSKQAKFTAFDPPATFMMEMEQVFYCATLLNIVQLLSDGGLKVQARFDSRKGSLIKCLLQIVPQT